MKKLLSITIFIFSCLTLISSTEKPLIYKISIMDEIGKSSWAHLQSGLRHAEHKQADYILLEMNTYGGYVIEADSMRSAILNSKIPIYVFINNNAASAGALIAISCDKIFMKNSANIGAATVVNETGEKASDKYQSYMRSLIRSTAESHGKDTIVQANGDTILKWRRDPAIAEAMVDERIRIPMLTDTTKVLTLTASEALSVGYCDGIAENVPEIIIKYLKLSDYKLESYNPTVFDYIKDFLMNGVVQSFLIMIIIGGIFLELKTPGIGLPVAVAITAALLYFTPLYMDGYAQNWEILLFVVGLVLIAFEIFVIPGFGVAGISGIILTASGLFLSLIANVDFDFDGVSTDELLKSLLTVSIGIMLSFALIVFLISKIGKTGSMLEHVALNTDQEGFTVASDTTNSMIGKLGQSSTVLRPSGKIFVDNEFFDAVALEGFIEPDVPVKVIKYENSQLYVIKV